MSKYTLRDRVKVDFKEVPSKQRQCEIGIITAISLRMPDTKFERTMITVTFDENYVKEKYRFSPGGIPRIILEEEDERITRYKER